MASISLIRLGISRCLLGESVRYDGGHKCDDFLVDVLGSQVEWVPVCPEVEAGLGVPREPMRLVGRVRAPRLMTIASQRDLTRLLKTVSGQKIEEFEELNLSGYVLKSRSPSCGVEKVPVYDEQGIEISHGMGLFARSVRKRHPLMPIIDEERLTDWGASTVFLRQALGYHRWSRLAKSPVTYRAVIEFHHAQAELLEACSFGQCRLLKRLVDQAKQYRPQELDARYGRAFMKALGRSSRADGSYLRTRS